MLELRIETVRKKIRIAEQRKDNSALKQLRKELHELWVRLQQTHN